MAERQSSIPTRRRALAALAGVAVAAPATAIAGGNPDAEIQRLHDAILVKRDEIARLHELETSLEESAPKRPNWPDALYDEVLTLAGLSRDITTMEFELHCKSLPDDVYDRVAAAHKRWADEID